MAIAAFADPHEARLAARGLLNSTIKMDITVPQQVMGSFFYTLDKDWVLVGNLGWQQWTKFGQIQIGIADSSNPVSLTTAIPFKDTKHAAIGAQYQLSEPWRLNFGVAYDTSMYPSSTVSPILPVGSAWRFGVGAEKKMDKTFSWGVAAEYLSGGTLHVSQTSAVPVALGGRGNLAGSFDNIGTVFLSANATWRF